jgi:hypothetical protein
MTLTLKQQKANRKKWVKALRSGKFAQQRDGYLRTGNGMCCLGVLADIAGCSWDSKHRADGDRHYAPLAAVGFVGLTKRTGQMADGRVLAELNDCGKSFAEIADIIESEPPGLFTA